MPYPTVEEVMDRVEFDYSEIGDDEPKVRTFIQTNLDDLIVEACDIGLQWTDQTMPSIVAKQIRAALIRFLRRPEGYIESRAGDEDLGWDRKHGHGGTPTFTEEEVLRIRDAATPGRARFGSIATTRYGPQVDPEATTYFAPIYGHTKQFPFAQTDGYGRVIVP